MFATILSTVTKTVESINIQRKNKIILSIKMVTGSLKDYLKGFMISWYALAQVFHRKFRRFGDYTATFISEIFIRFMH